MNRFGYYLSTGIALGSIFLSEFVDHPKPSYGQMRINIRVKPSKVNKPPDHVYNMEKYFIYDRSFGAVCFDKENKTKKPDMYLFSSNRDGVYDVITTSPGSNCNRCHRVADIKEKI